MQTDFLLDLLKSTTTKILKQDNSNIDRVLHAVIVPMTQGGRYSLPSKERWVLLHTEGGVGISSRGVVGTQSREMR